MNRSELVRTLHAFGLIVTIRSETAEVFSALDRQLPPLPGAPATASADVVYRVVRGRATDDFAVLRGRRTLAARVPLSVVVTVLVHDLQAVLARTAPGWTFVHAGVVSIDGRALVLPGRSGAGKSTLVEALVREGAHYASDEFAILDARGLVHPYRRWLALRTPEGALTRVAPEELDATLVEEGIPVDVIAFTEFRDGTTIDLRPLPPAQVALELLPHCPGVRQRPADTLSTLRVVAARARGFEGVRGDAQLAARALLDQARELRTLS